MSAAGHVRRAFNGLAWVLFLAVLASGGAATAQSTRWWHGRITDQAHRPIQGAEVHLWSLNLQQFLSIYVTSGADGSYRFPLNAVPAGRYHIGAHKAGYNGWIFSPAFQGFEVRQNTQSIGPVNFEMYAAQPGHGTVYGYGRYFTTSGKCGQLGPGARVDIYSGGRLVATTTTDANSYYQVNGLDTILWDGVTPYWGWFTCVASWKAPNGVTRQASCVNFRVWPDAAIRMDIWFVFT